MKLLCVEHTEEVSVLVVRDGRTTYLNTKKKTLVPNIRVYKMGPLLIEHKPLLQIGYCCR